MLDFTQKIINISHIKNIKINQKNQKGIKHATLYAIQTENKRKEKKCLKQHSQKMTFQKQQK